MPSSSIIIPFRNLLSSCYYCRSYFRAGKTNSFFLFRPCPAKVRRPK
ncbi:hypothetical protein NXX19_02810 [Bacteroides ovatus]|nr:hypothetical protein [Bacteroides ovatus]